MTGAEISVIVSAIIVSAVGIVVALIKILGPSRARTIPQNGDARLIVDAVREQSTLLRDIRDGVIAMRADLRMQGLEQAHLQKSVDALHSRIDAGSWTVR